MGESVVVIASVEDEQLLLDLLNTTETIDGVRGDTLAAASEERSWLDAHDIAGADVALLRSTRDTIQRIVAGDADARALAPVLTGLGWIPAARPDGIGWELEVEPPRAAAARAALAWDQLRRTAPGRLRPCSNEECTRYLIDRSKSGTARWCSMSGCGNRMKARRHYERQRTA